MDQRDIELAGHVSRRAKRLLLTSTTILLAFFLSAAFAVGTEPDDAYQEAVGADGPVAQYRFDDATGSSTVNDAAGTDSATNDGIALGVAGPFAGAQAGAFGGEASASIPSNPLADATAFSIEAWVDWSGTANAYNQPIVDLSSGSTNYFSLTPASGAGGHPLTFDISHSGTSFLATAPELAANSWHDIAVTETGETITLYVDGEAVGHEDGVTITPASLGVLEHVYVGKSHDSTTSDFEGYLSNVSIYDQALSDEQLKAHYQAAQGAAPDGSKPTIEGTPNVGQTLIAHLDAAGEAVGESGLDYEWQRCNTDGEACEQITHATQSEYEIQSADLASTIRVKVSQTVGTEVTSATSDPTPSIGAALTLVNHAPPTIAGSLRQAATVSAESGSWVGEGAVTYTYQWQRCSGEGTDCQDIPAGTSSTYTLRAADVGQRPRVLVTARDDNGSMSVPSAAAQPVAPSGAPIVNEPPEISGTAQEGQALHVSTGSWEGEDPLHYSYQWERCEADGTGCTPIAGDSDTYTPVKADTGSVLRAIVTASDASGQSTAVTEPTGLVSPATLHNTAIPEIAGDLHDGHTLTGTTGTWSSSGEVTYSYQWQRCDGEGHACSDLPGATSLTYTTTSEDTGHRLRLLVRATSPWGDATVPSEPTGPVVPPAPSSEAPPTIEGVPSEGAVLTAHPGDWAGGEPISYTYQWERCSESGGECGPIDGATSATLTAAAIDIAHMLRVDVTATSPWGDSTRSSAPTAAIASIAPFNTEEPWIFGRAEQGELLIVEVGGWTSSTTPEYHYQWERCDPVREHCNPIVGATGQTYLIEEADVDSTLQVTVTAIGYHSESSATTHLSGTVRAPLTAPGAPRRQKAAWIQGNGLVGEALIVHPGEWAGEQPIYFSYQWQRCNESFEECSDIEGATATSYTVGDADLDHALRVHVTATNSRGEAEETAWLFADITELEPHHGTPVNLSEAWVNGTATLGSVDTAEPGTWGGETPISYSYQWQRCNEEYEDCADISGATSSTYTPTDDDLGKRLLVNVTAKNEAGESSYAALVYGAAEDAPIQEGPPEVRDEPTVHGEPVVSKIETAQPGTWAGATPLTISYQWQRCDEEHEDCSDIAGATAATYEAVGEDVGHTLQVVVTSTNSEGEAKSDGWVYGGLVVLNGAPKNVRGPSVHGEGIVGEPQIASSGAWTGSSPISYSYQWQRCEGFFEACVDISEATSPEYTPTSADKTDRLQVLVTARNEAGEASATGWQFGGPVRDPENEPVPPVKTSEPEVHGNLEIGALLHTSTGNWTGEQPIEYAYQWQRCDEAHENCESIAGANSHSYRTTSEDAGHTMQVVVTAKNAAGEATSTGWLLGGELPAVGELKSSDYPSVTGEPVVGTTATVSPGTWEGASPITYGYQWERCDDEWENCHAITDATNAEYGITSADEGDKLQVAITITNPVGEATRTAWLFGEVRPPERTEPSLVTAPSLTGEAIDGHTLLADEGSWSGPGPINYGYQWQRCDIGGESCVDIPGATGAHYTLEDGDLGATLRVVVTATHDGSSVNAQSAVTSSVVAGAPVGERPVIGNEHESTEYPGRTIEVRSAEARGAGPITETYQWQQCPPYEAEECSDITGATGTSLALTEALVGRQVRVVAVYRNAHGTDTEASWPSSTVGEHDPILKTAPSFEVPPTGLGDGDVVSAEPGGWAGSEPLTYSYQWQNCVRGTCSDLAGATEASYTVSISEGSLRIKVTATNGEGATTAYSSQAVYYPGGETPELVHEPAITGEPVEGETLTVSPGTWHNEPTEFSYVWEDCRFAGEACQPIPEATGTTYTPTIDQAREYVVVKVTAANAHASSSTSTRPIGPIRATPPVNLELPTITGEPIVGNEMHATTGTWTNNTSLSFEGGYQYQWELCDASGASCEPITGGDAEHKVYAPPAADAGQTLRVTVETYNPWGENVVGAHSEPTAVLSTAEPVANTMAPTITGSPEDGQTLTANLGSWTGSPTIRYAYQWEACDSEGTSCAPISEAQGTEYTLTRTDVGSELRLSVTASNGGGTATSRSTPTDVVVPATAPTNVAPPEFATFNEAWPGDPENLVYRERTAEPGVWTGDPDISYRWERCDPTQTVPETGGPLCDAIPGGTSQRYMIRPADIGYQLALTEIATNPAGSSSATTGPTKQDVPGPEIGYELMPGTTYETNKGGRYKGASVVGQTITAETTASARDELPLTATYEFQRVNESGPNTVLQTGTSADYTITPDDLGHELAIVMTIDEWRADKASVVSTLTIVDLTHTVEEGPVNDSAPGVSGETIAGKPLSATPGEWHGGGGTLSYNYQWERCDPAGEHCTSITGATASSYASTSSDSGSTIRALVTAANAGATGTATSAQTATITEASAPENESLPTITGTAQDLQTLTAHAGTWDGTTPITYQYQWEHCEAGEANCEPLEGATSQTYTANVADVGSALRVKVTASNAAAPTVATSGATSSVAGAPPPVNTAPPTISVLGSAVPGGHLDTTTGTWENLNPESGETALTYQWQRCTTEGSECQDIESASARSYQLTSDDEGSRLRVVVTAENESGRTGVHSQLSTAIEGTGNEGGGGEGEAEAPAEKLLYTTATGVYAATMQGAEPHELLTCAAAGEPSNCDFGHPAISPDGQMIAVEVRPQGPACGGLEELCPKEDISEGSSVVLLSDRGTNIIHLPGTGSQPAWVPGSTELVYTRLVSQAGGGQAARLYSIDATSENTSEATPLETGTADSESASFSHDGSELAFVGRNSASDAWGLYAANPDGTEPQRLALGGITQVDQPVFTEDGKAIVFDAREAAAGFDPEEHGPPTHAISQAYEVHTDGSGLREITNGTDEVANPSPLPEDRLLVTKARYELLIFSWGISWEKEPPTMYVIPTDGPEAPEAVATPPEEITGVTAGTLGAHASVVQFPQYCSIRHKICGTWTAAENTKKARQYANTYAETQINGYYHDYLTDDCTNYVSQILRNAKMPMLRKYQHGEDDWWTIPAVKGSPYGAVPDHTNDWSVAEALYHHLRDTGLAEPLASGETPHAGDLVFFQWRFRDWKPSTINHMGMIVSGNSSDPEHEIYTSHNNNRLLRMTQEYVEIGNYLHDKEPQWSATDEPRGLHWEWFILRPRHLSVYVKP